MRRLTHIVPSQTLGPLRRYSGKLYGPRYLHVVEFLSMKHRLTKDSVRALLDSYWRYLTREVLGHGHEICIPGVGSLIRKTKMQNIPNQGFYETHSLIIRKQRMSKLHVDEEDDEDAGPSEE